MRRKSTSEILRDVDPSLKIISGGIHRPGRRKKAIKLDEVSRIEMPYYVPHKSTPDDWKAAGGEICPVCHKEAVQLLPYGFSGKRKACKECRERRMRLLEYKGRILEFRRRADLKRRKGYYPLI